MNVVEEDKKKCCSGPHYQAYQLLHIAFTLIPLIAGIDKFTSHLTVWQQYLSNQFNVLGNASTTMMVVGAVEIIAGLGVWFRPKYFAYIVALWLAAIIINLLLLEKFYDIALRDFGLFLGALALARLSATYDKEKTHDTNH